MIKMASIFRNRKNSQHFRSPQLLEKHITFRHWLFSLCFVSILLLIFVFLFNLAARAYTSNNFTSVYGLQFLVNHNCFWFFTLCILNLVGKWIIMRQLFNVPLGQFTSIHRFLLFSISDYYSLSRFIIFQSNFL